MLRDPEATFARNQKRADRLKDQLVNTTILSRFKNLPPLMAFLALALSYFALLVSGEAAGSQIVFSIVLFGIVALFVILVPQGLGFAVTSLAAIAVLKAAQPGSPAIHLVPMFIIFAAAALQLKAEARMLPRPSMIVLGVASFFLSILFTDLTMSPNSGGGGSTSRDSFDQATQGGPGLLERFVRWVSRLFGNDESGSAVAVGRRQPPEQPNPLNWARLAIILGIVLILLGLGFMIWRLLRRGPDSGTGGGSTSADLVRRFEQVGSDAGIPRSPSQGLMAYGQELSTTGDDRPVNTGGLVSGAIYDPGRYSSDLADRAVTDLETSPLPAVVTASPRIRLPKRFGPLGRSSGSS